MPENEIDGANGGRIRQAISNARKRRQPTGMQYAFADRIAFLNVEHWDDVAQGQSIFLSRAYLQVEQETGHADLLRRYCLIYRDELPVAAFVTRTLEITGDQLVAEQHALSDSDRKQLNLKALGRKALKNFRRRVMICGNLISWGAHGVAFRAGEDPVALWPAIAEGIYRLRRSDRLMGQTDYVVVKDLPDSLSKTAEPLSQFSYRRVATEPDMVLKLRPEWESFDGYLDSLNKKYRKAAKTVCGVFQGDEFTIQRLSDVGSTAPAMFDLYRQVASRAGVRLAGLTPEYLPTLASTLGEDHFAVTGIFRGEDLIGWVSSIRDGGTSIGYYLGLDYTVNESHPVYHRLLYAVIEQAIEWRCEQISFGRTALEPKSRLGCVPEGMSLWIRHRVPLLNLVVRHIVNAVPHDEPPERTPFKS